MRISKIFILTVLAGLIVLNACNQTSDKETEKEEKEQNESEQMTDKEKEKLSEINKLKDEVIKIHDEVMPKMGELEQLANELTGLLANPKDLRPKDLSKINSHIQSLGTANETMMEWMRGYNATGEGIEESKLKSYYKSELKKMKKVKEDMLGSYESARKTLEKFKEDQ